MRTKKAQTKENYKNENSNKGFLGHYWQYNNWGDKEDTYRYIQNFPGHSGGYRRRSEEVPNSYGSFDSGSADYYNIR